MSAYVLVIAPRVPTIHTCRITVDINVCACCATAARALPKINALSPNVFPSLIFSTGLLLNIIITCKQSKPDGRPYPRTARLTSPLKRAISRARLPAQHGCGVPYAEPEGARKVRIHSHNLQRAACNALRAVSGKNRGGIVGPTACRPNWKSRSNVRARDGMERTSPWIKMYIACAISPSR